MIGQDQLEIDSAGIPDFLRIGPDFETFADRQNAGSLKSSRALLFHQTHAAGADLVDPAQVAQCRDIDIVHLRGFEYRDIIRDRKVHTVYLNVNIAHSVSPIGRP